MGLYVNVLGLILIIHGSGCVYGGRVGVVVREVLPETKKLGNDLYKEQRQFEELAAKGAYGWAGGERLHAWAERRAVNGELLRLHGLSCCHGFTTHHRICVGRWWVSIATERCRSTPPRLPDPPVTSSSAAADGSTSGGGGRTSAVPPLTTPQSSSVVEEVDTSGRASFSSGRTSFRPTTMTTPGGGGGAAGGGAAVSLAVWCRRNGLVCLARADVFMVGWGCRGPW